MQYWSMHTLPANLFCISYDGSKPHVVENGGNVEMLKPNQSCGDARIDSLAKKAETADKVLDNVSKLPQTTQMVSDKIASFTSQSPPECQGEVNEAMSSAMETVKSIAGAIDMDMVLGGIEFLGDIAGACPMLGPIGVLVKSIVKTCNQARYNLVQAGHLQKRVTEIEGILQRLKDNLMRKGAAESTKILQPLFDILKEAATYIGGMTSGGFMKKLFKAASEKKGLIEIDEKITKSLQTLQLAVANEQLDLTMKMDDKLEMMMKMISNQIPQGCKEPAELDPAVLAQLAEQSGCKAAEEMKSELSNMSDQMKGKRCLLF
eukprot:760197-Hanusia_phi.AAC.1